MLYKPKSRAVKGRRRKRKRSPGDIEIWKERSRARRARRIKSGWEVHLETTGAWIIGLDSRVQVEHIGNAVAVNTWQSIEQNRDPGTGATRPKTKDGRNRFKKTGRFQRMIRRTKVTGNALKARTTIKSIGGKRGYDEALKNESKRGHRYFTVKGDMTDVIREANRQVARAALDGSLREPDVGMKKARSMLSDGK